MARDRTHTLRWDFDYNDMLIESDENNNSASVTWTSAPAGVDIEAHRAHLNTMTAAAGDEVTTPTVDQAVYFHLDYRIVGSGGAVPVERRALLDGQQF